MSENIKNRDVSKTETFQFYIFSIKKLGRLELSIWQDFLKGFDQRMRRRNRNLLLLCDNAPCHDHAELQLSNTRVAFLPPNITTLLRPLNQGNIQFAKAHYRTQLIRQLVITVDNNGTVDHFANEAEFLTAIFMIKRAFFLVTPQTKTNCFKKAGFMPSTDNEPESEEPRGRR